MPSETARATREATPARTADVVALPEPLDAVDRPRAPVQVERVVVRAVTSRAMGECNLPTAE